MRRPPLRLVLALWLLSLLSTYPVLVHARAAALVQSIQDPDVSTDDNAVTTAAPVTVGNLMVVALGVLSVAQTVTLSDDQGHTWTDCIGLTSHSTAGIRIKIQYAVATAAANVFTATSSGTGNTHLAVYEYSGMGTPTVDGTDTDEQTTVTTQGSNISFSPSTTDDTAVTGMTLSSTTASWNTTPSGYTVATGGPTSFMVSSAKIVNATSANTYETTTVSNESTVTVACHLKTGVGGGASGAPRLLLLGVGGAR